MAEQTIKSTSDQRMVNNTMRHQDRVLSEEEKQHMTRLKDMGVEFVTYAKSLGASREISLAITKMEEAVMWSVKHVTG